MHHWRKAFFIDYIFTHVSPYMLCTLHHHYIYTSYWNITQLWQETMTRSYVYTILTIHLLKDDQFQSTCHGSKLCIFSLSWNCYHPISTPRSMRFPLFYASIKILMASFDRTAYIATENTNIPYSKIQTSVICNKIPWLFPDWERLEFHWLFPDRGNPESIIHAEIKLKPC